MKTEIKRTENMIGTEGSKELSAFLKTNASLTYLDLGSTGAWSSKEGEKKGGGGGGEGSVAEVIIGTGKEINAEGSRIIIEALSFNSTLTSLDLTSNNIIQAIVCHWWESRVIIRV